MVIQIKSELIGTTTRRGFPGLVCPGCEAVDRVYMYLRDLKSKAACQCGACGFEFSIQHVADVISTWAPVLAWIEQAPAIEE